MIVVPAFSTTEDREHKTVPALVIRPVADSPHHVRQRIDEEGAVIQRSRGNKKPPDEAGKAPQNIDQQRVKNRRDVMVPIQETELRVTA